MLLGGIKMDIIPFTDDFTFNFFASIIAYPAIILVPIISALSLFRV